MELFLNLASKWCIMKYILIYSLACKEKIKELTICL